MHLAISFATFQTTHIRSDKVIDHFHHGKCDLNQFGFVSMQPSRKLHETDVPKVSINAYFNGMRSINDNRMIKLDRNVDLHSHVH